MFVVAGVRKPLQLAHRRRLEKWVLTKRRRDKRVFFVEVPAMDIQAEWEGEMRGGESIWDRAFRYTTQWEDRQVAEAALVRIITHDGYFYFYLFCWPPSLRNCRWLTTKLLCHDGLAEM
jgi:hypothetical protein